MSEIMIRLPHGGVLRVALAGDPPSLDMHQEQTFMVTISMSTVYNTLVMFDPHQYPKSIGDLAQAWTVSDDGMTWTFTLHQGVVSVRKSYYQMVKSIEAPERDTVVFRLHYLAAAFLSMLAHPANFIYAKKYLDQGINWYKTHTMGTGPFKLQEYIRGALLEFKRNSDYLKEGPPYLDGAKYFIIPDTGARAKSIRAERTDVEFRGFAPIEVESITAQMGDKVTAAHSGQPAHWGIAINVDKKPFDDVRVRQALSLALDRYEMVKTLGPLTGLDSIAGPMPSGTPWPLSSEELQALPGFGKDHEANLREAKRLLAEAGYPDGFQRC